MSRRPLPSFPEVSRDEPTIPPPAASPAAKVFTEFQETLQKLQDPSDQLDAIRSRLRDSLTPEERKRAFDDENDDITEVTVLPVTRGT